MENSENYLETDKLILEYVKETFRENLNYISKHDSKSGQILLVISILFGFLINSSNSIVDVLLKESCTSFIILISIFLLSIILIFISLFFALTSLRKYREPGHPKEIYDKLREKDIPKVVESFIDYYIKAFQENHKVIEQRAKELRWSIQFLKFGSICFFIFIIIFIVSKICSHFQ